MNIKTFSENEWIYPDTVIDKPDNTIRLDSPMGADAGFQILTDIVLEEEQKSDIFLVSSSHLSPEFITYRLLPARVEENSGPELFTTKDYESVAHFVTRKAPFYVYDVTEEVKNGVMKPGRLAFYVRIKVPDDFRAGEYDLKLDFECDGWDFTIDILLKVYNVSVPCLEDSIFSMINWLDLESIAKVHNVKPDSDLFWSVTTSYLKNQLDMRNNCLMLPSGKPIRDSCGKIVDFNFDDTVKLGNLALESGFKFVLGGFVARFKKGSEKEQYLLWDRDISVISFEAYRQLKIYFTKMWRVVCENSWQDSYMQCLVDEPQFANSEHYRILSCICRKFMPGVVINDPVESTDLEGAVDIWVVKQSIYENYIEKFKNLQELGEEIWIYTCGYPAGYVMNRVMDLPLLVSRLPMWMCYLYNASGFLHWGYNVYNKNIFEDTCYYRGDPEKLLPPGNAFIVYPGENGPEYSMRGHLQRTGAEDFELLTLLGMFNSNKAREIVLRICSSFDRYDHSSINFNNTRRVLLEELEKFTPY